MRNPSGMANNATDAAPGKKNPEVGPRQARRKPIPGRWCPLIELTALQFCCCLGRYRRVTRDTGDTRRRGAEKGACRHNMGGF